MNSERTTVETVANAHSAVATPTTGRWRVAGRTRLAALTAVALLGVTACNSQPSAKRVATDLVNTLAEGEQRECMLDKLDAYTQEQLKAIAKSASEAGPGTPIDAFEADLAECTP